MPEEKKRKEGTWQPPPADPWSGLLGPSWGPMGRTMPPAGYAPPAPSDADYREFVTWFKRAYPNQPVPARAHVANSVAYQYWTSSVRTGAPATWEDLTRGVAEGRITLPAGGISAPPSSAQDVEDATNARRLGMSLEDYRAALRGQTFGDWYNYQLNRERMLWEQKKVEEQRKTAEAQTQAKMVEAGYNQYLMQLQAAERQGQFINPPALFGGLPSTGEAPLLTTTPWGVVIGAGERAVSPEGQEVIGRMQPLTRGEVAVAQRTAAINAIGEGAYGEGGGSWRPSLTAKYEQMRLLDEYSRGFERMREQIMATTAPRDWVVREKARLAVNPYEESKAQFYRGDRSPSLFSAPSIPINPEPKFTGVPEVQANVQPFLGKEKTFGGALETPSGQAWSAAPWSTRESVIGYSEAMGHPEADLLGAMQAMRPNAPSRGISWAPARRR